MIDMSKKEKTREELLRDRAVLIDWIEHAQKAEAKKIAEYEKKISELEIEIEELSVPRFTERDAEKAKNL